MKLPDTSSKLQPGAGTGGPTPAVPQDLVDFAVETARKAGRLTLDWYQQRHLAVTTKRDGSPVTAADLATERFLRAEILAAWPDDGILGEEEGEQPGTTGRLWVIDPIDGTKAYTQGVPLYATLLALIDDHGAAVGVIHLPALDECVWAGRGLGTRWDGEPCQVSSKQALDGSYTCTSGLGYWPDEALRKVRSAGARVRTWGDAYGYALVATGRADAMVDPECFDWDVAPMSVIITEAGGRFSDTAGVDDWRNGSAVATNGLMHDDLLRCFE